MMDKDLFKIALEQIFEDCFYSKKWNFDNPELKEQFFKRVKRHYFALEQLKKEIEVLKNGVE